MKKKVALVHYWLVTYRGGERVLKSLLKLYPDAVIFTLVADKKMTDRHFPGIKIVTSWLQHLPFATSRYQSFLPLMPMAVESFDLRGFDLVIASESGPAKGVIVSPDVPQLCYCHSPMRYLYDLKGDYESGMGFFKKSIFRTTSHFLRQWDFVSAQRLDAVAVNSAFVGKRVKKYWSRDATVIAPPVAIENFLNLPIKDDGFYFLLTQLVPYKRVDLAIKIFNELKLPLVVAGEGSELKKCKELAGPTVRVLGSVPFEKVVELYTACRAFIFPGVEDFGIAPVEANACGKPVIALAQGGLLESQSAESALFFEDEEGFRQAVLTMEKEPKRFDASRIREHSKRFSEAEFLRQMRLWLRPYDSSFKVF